MILFDNKPLIYTTGAFLKPVKVIDSEEKEIWFWCVTEFIEDSYSDGKIFNPKEFANTQAELIVNTTEDDSDISEEDTIS